MQITVDISALPERLRTSIGQIAEARAENGIEAPLSLDDVNDIVQTCRAGENAYDEGAGQDTAPADAMLHMQVGIPGAVLHRPNYAARILLLKADTWGIPGAWAEYRAEWVNLMVACILAHAYDDDVIAQMQTPRQAKAIAEAWGASLHATCSDVADAVRQLTDGAYPPVEKKTEDKKETGKKPAASAPKPSPEYSALCARVRAAAPATGCTLSPMPTLSGCSAKSPAATASGPRQPATAPKHPSILPTPESKPTTAGAGLSSASRRLTSE